MLAERNRAFERLFNIVLAVLLVGSLALTLFASRLTARIRALRDDAERAIDAQGRVRARARGLAGAGDEIGDLSRSFSQRARAAVAVRELPGEHGEPAVARAAHAGRGGAQLARQPASCSRCRTMRASTSSARRAASTRLTADPDADDRGDAPRAEPRRRRARALRPRRARRAACVDGYRARLSGPRASRSTRRGGALWSTARRIWSRRCSTSSSRTPSSSRAGARRSSFALERARRRGAAHRRQRRAAAARRHGRPAVRLDGVGARDGAAATAPHLGLGLYIVRLIAEFHGGRARARQSRRRPRRRLHGHDAARERRPPERLPTSAIRKSRRWKERRP